MGDSTELQALEELLAQWERESVGVRRSLEPTIADMLDAMDPGSVPTSMLPRAQKILRRELRRELPANAIFVPFVDQASTGFVAAIQVHEGGPYESALYSKMTLDCQRACRSAIRLAAQRADRHTADGCVELVTETRGAHVEHVEGRSLSLGVFLSALALFTGRRVRAGTVVSGDLVNGAPRGVGRHETKLASLIGRDDVARVIVAADDHALAKKTANDLGLGVEVIGVDSLASAADAALGASLLEGRSTAEVFARARRAYGEGWGPHGWVLVEQAVTPLLGAIPPDRHDQRLELMTMLAAARRNAGDAAAALDTLDLAAVPIGRDERWIEKRVLAFYRRQRALALLDLGHDADAAREANASLCAAEAAGLRGDYAVALGTMTLVSLSAGREEDALADVARALEHLETHEPRASLRTRAYQVLALMKLRRVDDARAVLAGTIGACDDDYGKRAEGWMRAYMAGALLEMDEPRAAIEVLAAPVSVKELRRDSDLGPLLRLYLGEAWARLGEPSLALDTFQRVPTETRWRTPLQDRRVALTQLRRARLLAAAGERAAAEACLRVMSCFVTMATPDLLEAARREILHGEDGSASRQLASTCVRPWEPLFGRAGR
jgi:hypothetical protein